MKVVSVIILGVLATGLSSLYAQDVITLKTGEEIKAKVEEISSSEVKYKRFDNLNGPTIVIEKAKVFAINYENGTREVFNVIEEPTVKEGKKEFPTGAHGKNFYTGIYANPVGFLFAGPLVGVEFTMSRHVIIDGHIRIPKLGLLSGLLWSGEFGSKAGGIGVGIDVKYFTGGNSGGFYVGPAVEFWKMKYTTPYGDYWEGIGVIPAVNLGYKFQFSSGFYIRTGGYLGASVYIDGTWNGGVSGNVGEVTFFGMLDLSFGFNF